MVRFLLFVFAVSPSLAAGNPPVGASRLVLSGTPEATWSSAVGRFGGCSASAIRFAGSSGSTPAYLLTAGHCIDLSPTDVIVNRADSSRTVSFRYRIDVPAADRANFRSRRILYSTMKATDFALVELDATLQGLMDAGIAPLALSGTAVPDGDAVEWAGIPSNSIPPDEVFLRTGECAVSGRTDLVEWRWLWRNMLRNDCSDIFGGASGSPVLSVRSGMVVGVVTTGTVGFHDRGPDFECGRDNPCEVGPGRYIYRSDTSYAAPIAPLAGCHDANGVFTFEAPLCGIDPGLQARVLETNVRVRPGSRWNTSVTSDTLRYFRYKILKEGLADCRTEDGYGPPLPISAITRIQNPLPQDTGRYHLCIVAGPSPTPDDTWQRTTFATVVHLYADDTPPQSPPEFQLLPNAISFAFFPAYAVPDISLIMPKTETGTENTCADRNGYRQAYPVPYTLPADAIRLCLIAVDSAGNESPPYSVELKRPAIFPAGVIAAAGQRPSVSAPGAWITVKGVNLASDDAATFIVISDSAGKKWNVPPAYVSFGQLNALLPDGVATGSASLSVRVGADESNAVPISIEPLAPGLFTPNGVRYGVAAVFTVGPDGERKPAFACAPGFCNMQPIPAGSMLVFVAGGLGPELSRADLSVQLSGVPLEIVGASPGAAGSAEIATRMPAGFNLRGYLPATISVGTNVSSPVYLWLR